MIISVLVMEEEKCWLDCFLAFKGSSRHSVLMEIKMC